MNKVQYWFHKSVMGMAITLGLVLSACAATNELPLVNSDLSVAQTAVEIVDVNATIGEVVDAVDSTDDGCPAATADFVQQYDEVNGYCFLYPAGSDTELPSSGIFVVYGPALDESIQPVRAILTVMNIGPANGQTAADMATAFAQPMLDAGIAIASESITIGGESAILFPELPGELSPVRQATVVHNDTTYMLTIAPVGGTFPQADGDVARYWETAVSTFTFLP